MPCRRTSMWDACTLRLSLYKKYQFNDYVRYVFEFDCLLFTLGPFITMCSRIGLLLLVGRFSALASSAVDQTEIGYSSL